MSLEQPKFVEVEAYLVIEPKWATSKWQTDANDRPILRGGKITKTTQTRPTMGRDGGVVTKVKFRVDANCFLPLQPEAVVVINAGNAETIEVEAEDPRNWDDD